MSKRPHVLVVTSGWFGLGHMIPMVSVVAALRDRIDVRIALFTLPHESARLGQRGEDRLFDRIYLADEPGERHYLQYAARHAYRNRLRLHHVLGEESPDLVVTHWRMMTEVIDAAALPETLVVAILEESEWGHVEPGRPDGVDHLPVDEVIFADNLRRDRHGLSVHQHRVGLILPGAARPAGAPTLPAPPMPAGEGPAIVVTTGGGGHAQTHDLLGTVDRLARRRSDLRFVLLIGPLVPPDLAARIGDGAVPNVLARRDAGPELVRAYLELADLVVHPGGVGSTAECIELGRRFVVANPTGGPGENDWSRVVHLAERGVCQLLRLAPGAPGELLLESALERGLRQRPEFDPVPLDGAEEVAALLAQWALACTKASLDRRALILVSLGRQPERLADLAATCAAHGTELVHLPISELFASSAMTWDAEHDRIGRSMAMAATLTEASVIVAATAPADVTRRLVELPLPDGSLVHSAVEVEHPWLVRVPDAERRWPAGMVGEGYRHSYRLDRDALLEEDSVAGFRPGGPWAPAERPASRPRAR
jgi:hypothetical protein